MKTTGQSIPPELAAIYAQLVATNATAPGGVFTLRQQKKVRLLKRTRRINRFLIACYEAVDALIRYKRVQEGWEPPKSFRTEETKKIYSGYFDPAYWVEMEPVANTTIATYPGADPFTGPRNYAYPDPTNQPTKAVYSGGLVNSGAPRYTGATSGGYFRDTFLAWYRVIFDLQNVCMKGDGEPILVYLSATINASANARPSKAMLSMIFKVILEEDGGPELTTLSPPTIKPLTNYYRYRTPKGTAPFFNESIYRRGLYNGRRKNSEQAGKIYTKAVVLVAPMPMMGKRYNNNTSIQTDLQDVYPRLYQIRKFDFAVWSSVTSEGMVVLSNGDRTATAGVIDQHIQVEATKRVSAGRWYWEIRLDNLPTVMNGGIDVGIKNGPGQNGPWRDTFYKVASANQKFYTTIDFELYGDYSSACTTGMILGVALDLVAGTISIYKNGVDEGVMWDYMAIYETGEYGPIAGDYAPWIRFVSVSAEDLPQVTANFGQESFAFPVPPGFNAGVW